MTALGGACGAVSPRRWLCTRTAGHPGPDHVADDGTQILDRWPTATPTVALAIILAAHDAHDAGHISHETLVDTIQDIGSGLTAATVDLLLAGPLTDQQHAGGAS